MIKLADDTTRIINLTEATSLDMGMNLVTDSPTGTRRVEIGTLLDYTSKSYAANYDSTKTYAVGDYCTYLGVLYICVVAITTPEAWTSAHWEAVTVDDSIKKIPSIESRLDAIEEAEGLHKFGVSGIGQSASALTRLWDAVGMTAQAGTDGDNSSVVNSFDNVTPFNRRKCVGHWYEEDGRAVFHVNAYYGDEDYVEDGTMGDYVAVECPRAYFYMKDGVLGISAHQYAGWRPFDIFCHNHNENETIPYYYAPAYALALDANDNAVSLPGLDNEQNHYEGLLSAARTYNNGALGNLAIIEPSAYNFYEWALFTVEFATQNCQSIMVGCYSLRHSNDDVATFMDATHILINNWQAARVAGEYVTVVASNVDVSAVEYKATHKILTVTRCNSSGVADASGAYTLLTVEDLEAGYYEYDTTGATQYRIGARPYRTGSCNDVSTPSGSPVSNSDGYHPCKYRWRENPFGNQFHTAVDLFNERIGTGDDDYSLEWYFLPDPSAYTPASSSKPDAGDLATDKFKKLDIVTAHENYVSGYIKSKKYSEEYPDIWIPYETTGGSASTYFCDYAYLVNSSVVRSVRRGGAWSAGAFAGFSFCSAHYAPSYAYAAYGGDLCFVQ